MQIIVEMRARPIASSERRPNARADADRVPRDYPELWQPPAFLVVFFHVIAEPCSGRG